MTKPIRVVKGGTYSGKTHGIVPIAIDTAIKFGKGKTTVIAETIPSLRGGAVQIFKDVMDETNRWVEDRWIQNPMQYTFANKHLLEFKSFDTVGKAKQAGKRNNLFINEANYINFEIADALMTRTDDITWIDYNPDTEFWVDTEILTRPDAEIITLTYEDNEGCPESKVEELRIKSEKAFFNPFGNWDDEKNVKSKYWANWCRVYIKGLTGNVEGLIFHNWEIINAVPEDAEYLGSGTDFGKGGSDPTSTTDYYYYNGKVIWDEIVYQSQLRDSDHIRMLKADGNISRRTEKMFCDNSEPSKIRELQIGGFKAVGEKKETIDYGIGLIQEDLFLVTARSLNVIKELRKYKYDDDSKPIDSFNHTIDNARYFYVGKFGAKKKRKSGWGKSSTS